MGDAKSQIKEGENSFPVQIRSNNSQVCKINDPLLEEPQKIDFSLSDTKNPYVTASNLVSFKHSCNINGKNQLMLAFIFPNSPFA